MLLLIQSGYFPFTCGDQFMKRCDQNCFFSQENESVVRENINETGREFPSENGHDYPE